MMDLSFKKILIANRGEIACRLIKTCKRLNIRTVSIYSDADVISNHVIEADQSIRIGPPPVGDSYLNKSEIINACLKTGATAILPGYGFLSTDPDFVHLCNENNIIFIGPTLENINQFGLQDKALDFASSLGIPTLRRSSLLNNVEEAKEYASKLSYPVIIKSAGGGGGIGLTLCDNDDVMVAEFDKVSRLAFDNFANGGVYLEKFLETARHIEIQVFGRNDGSVLCLGERECSIQRRFQKIIEETPSVGISKELRSKMFAAAKLMCEQAKYRSVGTVEFIVDISTSEFFFMEFNTRLQVEHAVTEMVCGIDLVEWMIKLADDTCPLTFPDKYVHQPNGHALECRIYAEDPVHDFRPCSGTVESVSIPKFPWVRIENWISPGTIISRFYDPLLLKVIVHATYRKEAIERMIKMLEQLKIKGILTNKEYLSAALGTDEFLSGDTRTSFCTSFPYVAPFLEVLKPGMFSTFQNWPGRTGFWKIGVPPSGPTDDLSLRIANKIVGNNETACGIEMTMQGMTVKVHQSCTVVVTGAPVALNLNGMSVKQYSQIQLKTGDVFSIGNCDTFGIRTYLAIAGGFNVSNYLGSPSTFPLGRFGGDMCRILAVGDMLPLHPTSVYHSEFESTANIPSLSSHLGVGVIYGPHGSPDFFTDDFLSSFWSSQWRVHHNSNRLGVRLTGPKPSWARKDGGEAGLHPSNIHDCEYVVGSINFTGDHPVILGVDGPSLGGFVCPAVVVSSELWKVGQMKPGDTVQFLRVSHKEAENQRRQQNLFIKNIGLKAQTLQPSATSAVGRDFKYDALLSRKMANEHLPEITTRAQGDTAVLIEYGNMVLDFDFRLLVYVFMEWINAYKVDNIESGLLEVSPGVCSVQVMYNSLSIGVENVLKIVESCPYTSISSLVIPCRRIKLPLAFDDRWCKDAVKRYMATSKQTAPYLPSNIDFVARINGLNTRQQVEDIMLKASYLIMGLGDVYLNAPCAVAMNPCHRLVTSKYSPARTFTPEGAVGLGGAYLCIYGMESPGGYQLCGRTIPIWNKYAANPNLFNFFDKIQFYHVTDDELEKIKTRYRINQYRIDIVPDVFDVAEYRQMLLDNRTDIENFKQKQQSAFKKELAYWEETGMIGQEAEVDTNYAKNPAKIRSNENTIDANVYGNVWKILVSAGDFVKANQVVAILESMKMECSVRGTTDCKIARTLVEVGETVNIGDPIFLCVEKSKY